MPTTLTSPTEADDFDAFIDGCILREREQRAAAGVAPGAIPVTAIPATPHKRSHDRDLTGEFRVRTGSASTGFVRFEYFKRLPDDPTQFYAVPAYYPIASRDVRGWYVTCSCIHFGTHGWCKHAIYLRMAVIAWPCDGAELVPLAPEDGDGWAGRCVRCGDAECYRVCFRLPRVGIHHYLSCAGCGARPRI